MALRDLVAEALGLLPQADPGRCVHSHAEVASCQRCVTVCPTGAWTLDDDALGIDTARCDGCGLCAAHCPETALSLASVSAAPYMGQSRITLACGHAAAPRDAWSLPCVNALGLRNIDELYRAGLRRMVLRTGDCRSCPRRDEAGLVSRVAALNRVLQQRGLPVIALNPDEATSPFAQGDYGDAQPAQPKLSRRGFLHRMLGTLAESADDPGAPPSSVTTEYLPPPGTGDLALCVPSIDPGRCNGCDACVRICPHHALTLAPGGDAYRVTADACTGCGLCSDVCDQGAVSVGDCAPVGAAQIPLESRTCRACGARFHRPRIAAEPGALCHVCSRVNHGRNLFQVL